jgi:hypothetical protein
MRESTGRARGPAGRCPTPGAVAMAVVWLVTAVGAIAIVRLVAELVGGFGADGGLLALLSMLGGVAIAYSSIALLIHRRRPANRIAWVLAAGGLLIVLAFSGFAVGAMRYVQHGPADAVGGWFAIVGATALGPALLVAVPLLAILFPDGTLPGPRWRVPVVVVTGLIVASSVIVLIQPGPVEVDLPVNPLGVPSPAVAGLRELGLALIPIGLLASAMLAVAAVVTRYRRGGMTDRAQLKWLLAAIVVCAILLPPSFVDENGPAGFSLLDVVGMASLALVPLSVGIAVVRYRLYDIDRLISRTLAYAILTALLAGTFVVTNLALQALLADLTGSSTLITAVATLAVAALFQPLRRRVQRMVDYRFDRTRVDAELVVDGMVAQVRDQVDLQRLQDAVVDTVDRSVTPSRVGLWLRSTGGTRT